MDTRRTELTGDRGQERKLWPRDRLRAHRQQPNNALPQELERIEVIGAVGQPPMEATFLTMAGLQNPDHIAGSHDITLGNAGGDGRVRATDPAVVQRHRRPTCHHAREMDDARSGGTYFGPRTRDQIDAPVARRVTVLAGIEAPAHRTFDRWLEQQPSIGEAQRGERNHESKEEEEASHAPWLSVAAPTIAPVTDSVENSGRRTIGTTARPGGSIGGASTSVGDFACAVDPGPGSLVVPPRRVRQPCASGQTTAERALRPKQGIDSSRPAKGYGHGRRHHSPAA